MSRLRTRGVLALWPIAVPVLADIAYLAGLLPQRWFAIVMTGFVMTVSVNLYRTNKAVMAALAESEDVQRANAELTARLTDPHERETS